MREPNPSSSDNSPLETHVVPTQVGYDAWACFYDTDDNPLIHLEERFLPEVLGSVSELDIIDVGCGTGRHALPWAATGARVTAMDFSEAMLERARSKPRLGQVDYIQHDLTKPFPQANGSFDRVISCLVLEHIPDLEHFFGELGRICRSDGKVVLTAMHPAMALRGAQARFIEPGTGRRVGPVSYTQKISDYLMAAKAANLRLDHISEHLVDAELVRKSPRAEKYLGWPMLLLMRFLVTN
jgi:malonyl-CoA O-methyltransferase